MKDRFVKKGMLRTGVAVALALCLAIGGSLLYLTDTDSADNVFTVGNISIDLVEPNWNPDDGEGLMPNEEVAKDPAILNDGNTDAIVFMKVTVPVMNVTLVGDDGTKGEAANQEIVWLKDTDDALSAHANNFNANWIELTALEEGTDMAGTTRTYVFGYSTAVAPEATTEALFDKIQVKNLAESIGVDSQTIKVEAFAIQATDVVSNGVDVTAELNAANLQTIYEIYMAQNA